MKLTASKAGNWFAVFEAMKIIWSFTLAISNYSKWVTTKRNIAFCALFLLGFSVNVSAQLNHTLAVDEGGFDRGYVYVAKGDQILESHFFGHTRLTPTAQFPIASMSKQMTAFAIKKLIEEGHLSLSTKLDAIFPEAKNSTITVKDLLQHRSGISDSIMAPPGPYYLRDWGCQDLSRYSGLTERSKVFQYSNYGYCVLSRIVEKVSEQPFNEFLTANIFKPLGMNDTFSAVPGAPHADLIGWEKGDYITKDVMTAQPEKWPGSASVVTTPNDIIKWHHILRNKDLLSSREIQRAKILLRSRAASSELDISMDSYEYYTFGLEVDFYRGALEIHHEGAINGHMCAFSYYPDVDLFLVALEDEYENGAVYEHLRSIADQYLKSNGLTTTP